MPLLTITRGYIRLNLATPILVRKGSFLGLLHSGTKPIIAALESNDTNDYYWQTDKTLRSVYQNNKTYRFLVNPMADVNFYKNEFSINKNESSFTQKYKTLPVSVGLVYRSAIWTSATYNITNCNFLPMFIYLSN